MDRLWAPWRMEYIKKQHSDECIFCKAIETKDKGFILYQEKHAFVIMNTYPYNSGHIMVAPTRHTGDIQDLLDDEMLSLFRLVKMSIVVLKDTMEPDAFNVGSNLGKIAGAGVEDHIHIHIVPRWSGDTNFMPIVSDVKVVSQSLDQTYRILKEGFSRLKN